MAGVSGLEPEPKVLETSMLTIDTIPLRISKDWRVESGEKISYSPLSTLYSLLDLFIFPMHCVATAATAKLFEFKPVRRVFLVFCRHIIAFFAFGTLQNYVIS